MCVFFFFFFVAAQCRMALLQSEAAGLSHLPPQTHLLAEKCFIKTVCLLKKKKCYNFTVASSILFDVVNKIIRLQQIDVVMETDAVLRHYFHCKAHFPPDYPLLCAA